MAKFNYKMCLDKNDRFHKAKAKKHLASIGVEGDDVIIAHVKEHKKLPKCMPAKKTKAETPIADVAKGALKIAENIAVGAGADEMISQIKKKNFQYTEACQTSSRWCRFCRSCVRKVNKKNEVVETSCSTMDMKLTTDQGTCAIGFKRLHR